MNIKDIELLDVSLIIATYNEEESLGYVLNEIKDFNIGEIIIIDKNSCSVLFENLISSKFKISKIGDPLYLMKSIKNKVEINKTIESHIYDGVAVTKFLYWMKQNQKKKLSERNCA